MSKIFTLFWKDGKKEIINGNSISTALNRACYGAGTLKNLSHYINGDSDGYQFIEKQKRWIKRSKIA